MVYIFLANGFEEMEALSPVDILRRLGKDVKTVSMEAGLTVTGAHGIGVLADMPLSEVSLEDAEALVLPGGLPGADNLQNSEQLRALLCRANEQNILLAAICAAPKVLGAHGLLRGVQAVCYPGFEAELLGAEIGETPVVTDGNIVTAKGAAYAADFSFAIAKALGISYEKVRKGMLFAD